MGKERLQKIIAAAGVTSRRKAEELITSGRVRVNGTVVCELGSQADANTDRVEVEGYGPLSHQRKVYVALHKPTNVVSTVNDPEGRQTVIDLVQRSRAMGRRANQGDLPRLFPVGRLDYDAEGLILLTNDGELSNQLMHPRHHVPKTYLAKVKGRPDPKAIERMSNGVRLPKDAGGIERRRTAPLSVRIFKEGEANTWLEITVIEGRNHLIKRLCQAVGLWVIRLVRIDFAGISVDPLPAGAWRFLTPAEIAKLKVWGA